MVHTCPRCELRFESETELADHLERDHGVEVERGYKQPDDDGNKPL
jgi:uncharacterized C2H2 Zn-finger protein